ncbi:hypothetical protein [Sulfurimonas sp.]|uniref:hypothetical protein n=1 Tax=Sulfurimonas sp. TaxID=2022749 RepID=UPI003D0E52F3
MNKNDLKLIGAFIDTKNPNPELNFALVKPSGIYATDTRKAIRFKCGGIDDVGLIHKKLLKGFENCLGKDETFGYTNGCFSTSEVKLPIDGSYSWEKDGKRFGVYALNFPDINKTIDMELPYHFTLDTLDDIAWELSQKNCFIDDVHLNPIIAFNECNFFDVFYKPQEIVENTTNTGIVKIVGSKRDNDGVFDVAFTALVMGREFKSRASE